MFYQRKKVTPGLMRLSALLSLFLVTTGFATKRYCSPEYEYTCRTDTCGVWNSNDSIYRCKVSPFAGITLVLTCDHGKTPSNVDASIDGQSCSGHSKSNHGHTLTKICPNLHPSPHYFHLYYFECH